MKKVFVTWPLHAEALARLAEHAHVLMNPNETILSRADLIRGAAGAFGLLTTLRDRIDAPVLEATGVKIVANMAVGYDNIDVQAAKKRRVFVTNTPGVLTETTADLTFALILALGRRVVAGDALVRAGAFKGWHPGLMLGRDIHGKTLGIVGLGRIGRAVARRAHAFGMRVLYHGGRPVDIGEEGVALDRLLDESDVVTIHCPLTADTQNLIGARELARMHRHAVLINTARGEIVDNEALIHALETRTIGGAALDVYPGSPERADARLFELDNVVLTPHVGSATVETRAAMADRAVDNLLVALKGKKPPDLV
ncbi:MAG: glyoxylate reductase [Myxococcota bacterium]|jgi:glyoxylate reductase